ncbi:MAG TPA: AraC family transcriptional regulator [Devosia sp.]|nr:AraC family transcriptional regulator [Devosia sp.]
MEPLADVITLLRPRAVGSKIMRAAGRWALRRSRIEFAGYGLVLAGACWLAVDGHDPVYLTKGDFVLVPAGPGMTLGSDLGCEAISFDGKDALACQASGGLYGDLEGEVDFQQLGGYFELDAANRGLINGLVPFLVVIRATDPAAGSLKRTIESIVEEALADRPGRDLVVDRLIEVLLVQALRFRSESVEAIGPRGLLAGLTDPMLARALKRLHEDVAHPWSVDELAREAGLSRSAFSERFGQKVGVPPMQYLMEWRMALAKAMLQRESSSLEAVATAIGYQSASAFSTAFRREVGRPPSHFARETI